MQWGPAFAWNSDTAEMLLNKIIAPETPNDERLPPPLIKNLRGIWQCVLLGDGGEVFRRSIGDSIRVISNFIGF